MHRPPCPDRSRPRESVQINVTVTGAHGIPGAEWSMTANTLDIARAHLRAALQEESEALASAHESVKTSGRASAESADALRESLAAHARSNAAAGEVRALVAEADSSEAAAQPAGHPPLEGPPKPQH